MNDDTISRQVAIDALAEHEKSRGHNYTLFVDIVSECAEIIRNLPPAQQWIPCSERLPVDDDYRESMECLDGCVWYFTDKGSMGLGHYYYSTKEWFTLRDLKPDGKVIAWMPLPEPYEENEK